MSPLSPLPFGAGTARAAEDDSTPVSVLIGDAVAEYDAGHFQEARALFRQAHERQPTARTLRGIGMCSFELRDYVEATRALTASLRESRRPLTSEQKRHAEMLLARAHTFVARISVKIKPAGASLFVDGHPAELESDGVLLLAFGRHQLSLRCSSCVPTEKEQEISVSGGEHKDIELALAPAPPPALPDSSGSGSGSGNGSGTTGTAGSGTAAGVVTQPGGERDASAGSGSAHLWFTGAAIAAAVGAGGSALWWLNRQNELDACRKGEMDGTQMCTSETTIVGQRRTAIGLTIGLGAAAVVSGVFAGLLWPHSEQPAPAVACLPGNNMVSCAFRF